jgi:DNA-directed RNA polymerase specialized sigma24 family protein
MEPAKLPRRGSALCPPPDAAEGAPLRDETSFEEFYAGVFNRLVGQLFLVTGSLPEAEDVVQEALTRAAGRWTRLRDYDVRKSGFAEWP